MNLSNYLYWDVLSSQAPPPEASLRPDLLGPCEVCGELRACTVAAMPGVPLSVAYCAVCLAENAHPWGALVFNTAAIGGLGQAAQWWVDMVAATCLRLNKTAEEFTAAVRATRETYHTEEDWYRQIPAGPDGGDEVTAEFVHSLLVDLRAQAARPALPDRVSLPEYRTRDWSGSLDIVFLSEASLDTEKDW